jgi:formyl-CoA transferase
VASRAGCSSARAGRPTRTPTSTSRSRNRTGRKPAEAIGHPEWAKDPEYATAHARQPHIFDIFAEIEKWLADKTKFEAVDILRKFDVPCGPVLSMKDLAYDPFLRVSGSIVEVQHEKRGSYLTVGCPIKFSGFTPEITGAPLLGEHTDEVLTELGYSKEQIAKLRGDKVVASSGLSPAPQDILHAS